MRQQSNSFHNTKTYLDNIEFTDNQVNNRILLKKVLPSLINLDTSISIMLSTLSPEEYREYEKYVNIAIDSNISRLSSNGNASIEIPKSNGSLLSDSFCSKIYAYHGGLLRIMNYMKTEIIEENDSLFDLVMEIFEDMILGLYSTYCIHYVIYGLIMRTDSRLSGYISFLANIVHGNDQRRIVASLCLGSLLKRLRHLSDEAREIVDEYIFDCKNRIISMNDGFSDVLLSQLWSISENPVLAIDTATIPVEKEKIPVKVKTHLQGIACTRIEVYEAILEDEQNI
ncbi:hypothetical protein NEPAR06_0043 [Nematocida parisii]|uniref:Uncharacterized protein n=1 Tax=Nematocida parisii (strain ERTm3) TaxID=935791 RepID=I3EE09_NEMP3|nr:uncharacterized protein NEPG_00058 [Nematocida parisii ERTm1]EIJ87456.1 hypothetical protein NEQG_02337 [Nematocida parisii ERTm3]KAI5127091.1 hypothetical protein NEPAR08_0763 [Nematocida parisii]EIJ94536.1 hypothetical protein NEPG_00058 [Nematocida parisii ERTm1]KAI5127638.1 hypothetical protein NEPAR03_1028 [Nematocida parisii]KAI5141191.1 hypothetical protein NEPAR04_0762 [Nematocida parisii]|eukprot:XP_013057892.1 hypothetical protein NEPG_00058 [Nematocida parisii ERTm1]